MISAIPALVDHPEQWELFRTGQVSTASAVDEVLRWTTPAMHFGRTATERVAIGDHQVERGDIVVLWNPSANRDERVFEEPERFLLGRTSNRHLTFGYGPHFCIGAYLGRAEVGAVLDALRTYAAGMSLTMIRMASGSCPHSSAMRRASKGSASTRSSPTIRVSSLTACSVLNRVR